ncbi:MAG: choice-of-anchor D domain-containing protein [Myxococcus sp.]|nr:choice-of-anchor D domain-containing protein [Myxococcus sp.]
MRTVHLLVAVLVSVVSSCRCGEGVSTVKPSLSVAPASVDFGQVKSGDRQARTLTFEARTQTAVSIASISLEPGTAPGGVEGFVLGTRPMSVDAFGKATLPITFAPTQLVQYQATLVVTSNDADKPVVRVPLVGEGARPIISITPVCERAQQCTGSVVVAPPAIDFGLEPLSRPVVVPASQLPGVVITNDGPVPLSVTKVAIEGADAAAFTFARTEATPWELMPGEGRTPQLRFTPTSAAQMTYQAQLIVESEDPDRARVVIELRGALLPNQPPRVCFNLTRVTPPPEGGGPRDYAAQALWAPLLTPPAGGYDFTLSRDVRPGELVQFSALSDLVDASTCTTDPESGRANLTYAWRLIRVPMGARVPTLSSASAATTQLRPVVTGDYVVELTVSDGQASTVVTGRFACAIKQDLVVQLEWTGFDGVDLDLHLVRPSATSPQDPFSGAFEFFDAPLPDGGASQTSGDLNGYAARTVLPTIVGANFNWGDPSALDDPKLNLDNTGSSGAGPGGDLIENISLDNPEHDATCATAPCTYRVFVHAFRDERMSAPLACTVDGGTGCRDGERCSCALATERCVAESAPIGDAGVGAGKCYVAPTPMVRIFVKGATTPARVIPLEGLTPPDAVFLGAPCQMWAVAEIGWPPRSQLGTLPDGGTPPPTIVVPGTGGGGRLTSPVLGRFGYRPSGGSLRCTPDLMINGTAWYGQNP